MVISDQQSLMVYRAPLKFKIQLIWEPMSVTALSGQQMKTTCKQCERIGLKTNCKAQPYFYSTMNGHSEADEGRRIWTWQGTRDTSKRGSHMVVFAWVQEPLCYHMNWNQEQTAMETLEAEQLVPGISRGCGSTSTRISFFLWLAPTHTLSIMDPTTSENEP